MEAFLRGGFFFCVLVLYVVVFFHFFLNLSWFQLKIIIMDDISFEANSIAINSEMQIVTNHSH